MKIIVTAKLVALGLAIFLLLHAVLGQRPQSASQPASSPKLGVAQDLGTDSKTGWETTRSPIVAESAKGKLYVVWSGKAQEKSGKDAGLPFIPSEMTFESKDPGFAGVPGVSVRERNQWSKPQTLVLGVRECTPVFAWCIGEDLHMLIADEIKNICRHIVLGASAKQWKNVATLPIVPSQYDAFRVVGDKLYIACVEGGVHYLAFDKGKWTLDLLVEGSKEADRVRMAINGKGNVHLAWSVRNSDQPIFCALEKGRKARTLPSFSDHKVSKEDFDLAVDSKGRPVVAYQTEENKEAKDSGSLYVRTFLGKKWSKPMLVPSSKPVLGGIRMVSASNGTMLLTWLHRIEVRNVFSVFSGPARSFVVSTKDGWTKPHMAAKYAKRQVLEGPYMSSYFVRLHLDRQGLVHMVWGGPVFYHAVIANLRQAIMPSTMPSQSATKM